MQILYDGQIYALQKAGGINRYFANLISRLPENITPTITTCELHNVNFPQHTNLKTFFYQRFGFKPGRICYWLEQYYFQAVSYFNPFSVLHPTYYSTLTRREMKQSKHPIVLTVYDLIHELFAEQMDATGEQAEIKQKAILSADAIICISENTKQDLLERYSVSEDRVTVTHLASEIDASMSYSDESVPSEPYYLYVGGRGGYKNFDRLLVAFAKTKSIHPEIKLCVVGSTFSPEEKQRISELKLEQSIEHYGHVSDPHLAKLYRCALAFVYPSLYEGFGIPPLEAMSCGTPVIASNTSSIPEVVADAGILFNPESSNDLADILISIVDNPLGRERLILKGYERSKLFSWDKTVAETLEVYHSFSRN